MQHTNLLSKETSPYLLQHQHNPVQWYPWSEEALQKAKNEDKPILVSIGYSSCHWCHVMERESFEDEATAEIMNRHFINIKIDREERPDLDHIYMDAVQAMTGSGGWPLNVFLTPALKPFYGGTYFPPVRAYNRASWKEVLYGVADAFAKRRDEIEEQASQLTNHLQNANSFGAEAILKIPLPVEELFPEQSVHEMFEAIMKQADEVWGGFGRAPKFPQTFVIRFLLQYYHFTKNEKALQQACLSLDKMREGGIYDHIGGGFARYSTDNEWLAPHFEKMLYDNALLVMALSEAYQITQKEIYKTTIIETLDFIEREMRSPEHGFYSALDADSEGVEGKYYTWSKQEVEALLKEDAALFCEYYDVSENGNREHVNIPRTLQPAELFCKEHQLNQEEFLATVHRCKQRLLTARFQRIRPLPDDKILLSWNALMNTAYSKAFAVTGIEAYRQTAISNMNFLLSAFAQNDSSQLFHTCKNKTAKYPAFLDDYTFLIQALIALQEITSDTSYLIKAKTFTQTVIELFLEPETGFFFYTPEGDADIIVRKKEMYDGATPSGNAVMAVNLYYLGIVFDEKKWQQQSITMTGALQQATTRYPTSFGVWAGHLYNLLKGFLEIAVTGKGFEQGRDAVNGLYLPNKIIQGTAGKNDEFPLLNGKTTRGETLNFYLCKNYSCAAPVSEIADFIGILLKRAI
ncbi:MAG: thioredoxin domain-containing protein [Chitinophagaceae bacterium]|nr:thioredoxin domain-containing protein [Chitinophagaceae bacterium]